MSNKVDGQRDDMRLAFMVSSEGYVDEVFYTWESLLAFLEEHGMVANDGFTIRRCVVREHE